MEASSPPGFRLDQTFFINDPSDKKYIHEEIFWLVWRGEGRWDWNTVYNWPVWLRKYYVMQLTKILTQQTPTNPSPKKSSVAKPPF